MVPSHTPVASNTAKGPAGFAACDSLHTFLQRVASGEIPALDANRQLATVPSVAFSP